VATDSDDYLLVLEALAPLLAECKARGQPILGVNFGELALGDKLLPKVANVLSDGEVPWFYVTEYPWKRDLMAKVSTRRHTLERQLEQAGCIPWWVDRAFETWLIHTGESRQPPGGHGCELGFRWKCKTRMGEYFWN